MALFFFLFLSLLSFPSSSSSKPSSPYTLVNQVCRKQKDVDFCLEVLKSDKKSAFAKDMKSLTKIALGVATKNVTNTRDDFRKVLASKKGSRGVLRSLKTCIGSYDFVLSSFKTCLKEEDCNLTGYDIHVAGDEAQRCQAIVDSNGAHRSFITSRNNITTNLCWFCESIANRVCDTVR